MGFENLFALVSKLPLRGFSKPLVAGFETPRRGSGVLAPDSRASVLSPLKVFAGCVDEPGDGVRGPQRVAVVTL